MTIKVIENINVSSILETYYNIESQLQWLEDDKTKQCGLQHLRDAPSFTDACGRLKPLGSPAGRLQKKEHDFSVCHELIVNTIFGDIIQKYNLVRTRLMWVKPKSCYSLHGDFSPRIHIPLVTNPSAMFVFKETGIHHLPVGKVYWVDTRKIHSFANFGDKDRLHIIGCV